MSARTAFLKIINAAVITFVFNGCGDSTESSKNSAAPAHSPNIALNEIKNAKCLNLEKYLNLLNSGIGNPIARRISTSFEVVPYKQNHITKNFELRLALGNFIFEEAPISEFMELKSISQVDCEKVTQPNESGPQEYKIIRSGNDSITISNQWNSELTYQWASPNHLIVTSSFVNGDYLCDENSKGRVSVTKDIFWAAELGKDDRLPEDLIKDSYLDLLSEATGYSKSNLFLGPDNTPERPTLPTALPTEIATADLSSRIYIHRLKEMSSMPIKTEALVCN